MQSIVDDIFLRCPELFSSILILSWPSIALRSLCRASHSLFIATGSTDNKCWTVSGRVFGLARVPKDFASVQEALLRFGCGGITIAQGYSEVLHNPLLVDKTVFLRGEEMGPPEHTTFEMQTGPVVMRIVPGGERAVLRRLSFNRVVDVECSGTPKIEECAFRHLSWGLRLLKGAVPTLQQNIVQCRARFNVLFDMRGPLNLGFNHLPLPKLDGNSINLKQVNRGRTYWLSAHSVSGYPQFRECGTSGKVWESNKLLIHSETWPPKGSALLRCRAANAGPSSHCSRCNALGHCLHRNMPTEPGVERVLRVIWRGDKVEVRVTDLA
mmetsp:Transcript_41515/g.72946  ORF Transcript_41515/g.72946 Transcript_41515/m.72946 type:complete len:325 (+) Transcript_41515:27-1001(+)